MDEKTATLDAAIAAAGSKATYAGSTASVLGWLTSNEAAVVIGILVGVIGLLVNVYFKIKDDRRQQDAHDARMRAIRGDYP